MEMEVSKDHAQQQQGRHGFLLDGEATPRPGAEVFCGVRLQLPALAASDY